mgnify:FL=1
MTFVPLVVFVCALHPTTAAGLASPHHHRCPDPRLRGDIFRVTRPLSFMLRPLITSRRTHPGPLPSFSRTPLTLVRATVILLRNDVDAAGGAALIVPAILNAIVNITSRILFVSEHLFPIPPIQIFPTYFLFPLSL